MRYKSLGVLITASFLTLGACASSTPTAAPLVSPDVQERAPSGSPIGEDLASELPGVVPGESVPLETEPAG